MTTPLQLLETPDGISFYHQGEEEARWIFDEIFTQRCYDTVKLSEKPVIIDAGANIGLYTLFAKKNYPEAQVLAFEPARESGSIFNHNMSLHKLSGVELHECALGSKSETKMLTFYPNNPAFSTTCSDGGKELLDLIADKVSNEIAEKMRENVRQAPVPVRRLSEFLRDWDDIKKVDLLKIDTKGGELDVIKGLDEDHLLSVKNIVMELWSPDGQLEAMRRFLEAKGYTVTTALLPWSSGQAEKLKVYMLTAQRF
ncbi:family methyltransferase [Fusarium coicis]|nr:family methyltransferase [Fusarium coicis]